MIGTVLSAMLYVLVTAVVMGLVAHHTLINTGSPFVNAFQSIFPHEAWAGKFIAAIAVISGIGALNGWTLIVTETSRAIAQDDMFPRPFAWTDRKGTAWFGIVVGTALPSLLMFWRYTTTSGLTVFTYLVDLTVVTVAIPYFMSAIAQLTFLVSRRRRVQRLAAGPRPRVAGASVLFSMWVTFASGYQVVYQALVVILAGLVLYAFLNARRQRLGESERADGAAPSSPLPNPSHRRDPTTSDHHQERDHSDTSKSIQKSASSARRSCTVPVSSSPDSLRRTSASCSSTTSCGPRRQGGARRLRPGPPGQGRPGPLLRAAAGRDPRDP